MKPFLSINDYGTDGFTQLSPLLALSERVNIWAPSAYLLNQSNSILNVEDLIWLVENRYISVIARRKWFFDQRFRMNHPWDGARWYEKLDAPLRDIAKEDERLPKSQKRVILADEERGFTQAEEILSGSRKKSLENKLRNLFNKGLLPIGIQEKAVTARGYRQSVPRQILRDYFNHLNAISESASNSMVAPDSQFVLIANVLGENLCEFQAQESISNQDFCDALKIVQAIKPTLSVKDLKRFLQSQHRVELSNLLFEHQGKTLEIPIELSFRISSLLGKASPFLRLTGFEGGLTRGVAVSGGILSSLISLYIDPSNPWASIGLTLVSASIPFADHFGMISNEIHDKQLAALVYLSHKRTKATDNELRAIEKKVSNIVF